MKKSMIVLLIAAFISAGWFFINSFGIWLIVVASVLAAILLILKIRSG